MASKRRDDIREGASLLGLTNVLVRGDDSADNQRVQELQSQLATMQDDIRKQLIAGFHVHKTGVNMAGWVDGDLWLEFGKLLKHLTSSLQWVVGDWLVAGINYHYGDKAYDLAAEFLPYTPRTLEQLAYVARQISIRIENLTFGHHALVAAKHEDEQRDWLEKAQKNGWSVAELRRQINGNTLPKISLIADKKYRNTMNRLWRHVQRDTLDKIKDDDIAVIEAWLKGVEEKRKP